MIAVPAGRFTMGRDATYPEERPRRLEAVGEFEIDRFAVTNARFAAFVAATAYRTTAERIPERALNPGMPAPFFLAGS